MRQRRDTDVGAERGALGVVDLEVDAGDEPTVVATLVRVRSEPHDAGLGMAVVSARRGRSGAETHALTSMQRPDRFPSVT